jgi:hypothetical protein
MAAVTVFVDRAVQGDLPPVCVRTGEPATTTVTMTKAVGGLGWAWVLVVLGPLGWLALAIASMTGAGQETLEVTLPFTRTAWERYRSRSRTTLVAWGVLLAATIAAVIGVGPEWISVPILIGALAVALIGQIALTFQEIGIRLDASRRWVTLQGVHDRFADAIAAESRSSGPPL